MRVHVVWLCSAVAWVAWGASAGGAWAGSVVPVDPALARVDRAELAAGAGAGLRAPAVEWAALPGDPAPTQAEPLPPVVVDVAPPGSPTRTSSAPTDLGRVPSFSTRVGPNRQPAWTTHRRFATVRSYVIAPGQVELESWWEGKFKKSGDERHRWLEEISLGLPNRFQVDLYWRIQSETGEATRASDLQVEVRHALAPWGCLPLNPTLYGEWKVLEGQPDVAEGKLLLSDELGPRAQWSFNVFYERQLGGEEEVEWGASLGVGFSVCDPKLSVGVEAVYENTTVRGARGDPEQEVLLGPTIQWRPLRGVHLDVAPLLGLTDDSPDVQVWVVLGIDLLPGTSRRSASLPVSSRAR